MSTISEQIKNAAQERPTDLVLVDTIQLHDEIFSLKDVKARVYHSDGMQTYVANFRTPKFPHEIKMGEDRSLEIESTGKTADQAVNRLDHLLHERAVIAVDVFREQVLDSFEPYQREKVSVTAFDELTRQNRDVFEAHGDARLAAAAERLPLREAADKARNLATTALSSAREACKAIGIDALELDRLDYHFDSEETREAQVAREDLPDDLMPVASYYGIPHSSGGNFGEVNYCYAHAYYSKSSECFYADALDDEFKDVNFAPITARGGSPAQALQYLEWAAAVEKMAFNELDPIGKEAYLASASEGRAQAAKNEQMAIFARRQEAQAQWERDLDARRASREASSTPAPAQASDGGSSPPLPKAEDVSPNVTASRILAPTLAQAVAAAKSTNDASDTLRKGEATGRSEGGKAERPSHASYYSPLPVGGFSMPKRDERSADVEQKEEVRRRVRARSV